MENSGKTTQKLSLSNTYNKLHETLWQQKQKNSILQKQNTILKSKISFTNENIYHKVYPQECEQKKKQLKKIYEAIKNQQEWILKTQNMIEQKNYQKIIKKKTVIEKNLTKYNKKAKQIQKKLNYLQTKLQQQRQYNQNKTTSLKTSGEHSSNIITQQAVLAQLQNENNQLYDLLAYKQNKLESENQQIKKVNKQILQLIQLKNFLKKWNPNSIKQNKSSLNKENQTQSTYFRNKPNLTQLSRTNSKNNSLSRPFTSNQVSGINFKDSNRPKLTLS